MIALDLLCSVQREASSQETGDREIWGRDRKDEEFQAPKTARAIWDERRHYHVEAAKAYSICGVMLEKIRNIRVQYAAQSAEASSLDVAPTPSTRDQIDNLMEPDMNKLGPGLDIDLTTNTANTQLFLDSSGPDSMANVDWMSESEACM